MLHVLDAFVSRCWSLLARVRSFFDNLEFGRQVSLPDPFLSRSLEAPYVLTYLVLRQQMEVPTPEEMTAKFSVFGNMLDSGHTTRHIP